MSSTKTRGLPLPMIDDTPPEYRRLQTLLPPSEHLTFPELSVEQMLKLAEGAKPAEAAENGLLEQLRDKE